MDRDTKELAKTGLEIYSREISPLYEQHRQQLLGELSVRGCTIEDLSAQEENDRHNVQMVSDFVKALPDSDGWKLRGSARYYGFVSDDIAEILAIRKSVVWIKHSDGWHEPRTGLFKEYFIKPYYVVGEKHSNSYSKTFLLAHANCSELGDVCTIALKKRELKKMIHPANFTMVQDDEVRQMFNPENHRLYLNPGDNQTIVLKRKKTTRITHLSDELLATYNVFDHLNDLATVFAKEKVLADLLSKPEM